MKDYFFARVPFFLWIFKYDFKENIVKDLISGITIGVVHIPQGIFDCFLKMFKFPFYLGIIKFLFLKIPKNLKTFKFKIKILKILKYFTILKILNI